MSVSDLTGTSNGGTTNWKATVTVTVVDGNGNLLNGAVVTGDFNNGGGTGKTCTTAQGANPNGKCSIDSSNVSAATVPSLTFTVSGISKSGYNYNSAFNVKTSVTVNK